MRTLLVSFLRIAIVVFVLFEIIGITSIDWFMFHPEMVRETYDAATEPVGGLVLEAPFLSAPRVVTKVRLLPIDPFSDAARLRKDIRCPVLILHGTNDCDVPFAQGAELCRLAQSANDDVRFVAVDGADHTEIAEVLGVDAYLDLLAGFVAAYPITFHDCARHNHGMRVHYAIIVS